MLVDDDPRQRVRMLSNELAESEENRRALVESSAAPAIEGAARRGHRPIDIRGRGKGYFRRGFASGGIVDRAGAVGGAVVAAAGDPVIEAEHVRTIRRRPALVNAALAARLPRRVSAPATRATAIERREPARDARSSVVTLPVVAASVDTAFPRPIRFADFHSASAFGSST